MTPSFTYVVETSKSFQDAVIAVRKAAEAHKWGILGDYDFSEILAAKGFPQTEHVKSLDICAPAHAHALMGAERLTGLCMPCSILIFTEKGKTKIAAMRPGAVMPQLFPHVVQKVSDLPQKIDAEIQAILEAAAQ
ncbi:MAG: DUF302 domain-containing protein [Candidatus Bipolaricaulota bacterium]|nr:DUF302 domain-containing protein [Candidatus Bipolaricaulota bacterium]MCS7275243.1 DUF302 domain-containing protein [Candidatus Bipolaricaulota bacterium]MDW8111480.1 DUF302 domain-containing protein [Candidatus Bipolaricaulota bacterium]MDW8328640.1 DUF302 domain-containing protein [Candidatus Bipolaricaulota bacterium]